MRFSRLASPVFHNSGYQFEIGKAETIQNGNDVAIIATGLMVAEAIEAAKELKESGISARVINISTIKPIDKETLLKAAKECGKLVTVEEHSVIGGLGDAVCSTVSESCPVPVKKIGVNDVFGQSGPAKKLLKMYGLCAENIVKQVQDFMIGK